MPDPIVIIGGGPAGLAAAYECGRRKLPAVVIEKDLMVGGISRTIERKGFRFDMGGHRFFTKCEDVNALWREVLGGDFLRRPRLSRIYFDGKFVAYPLKPMDALLSMGIYETAASILSYLAYKISPNQDESSFEGWTENQFGRRLYQHFFQKYTEKVWGIPCNQIASEWGAQRIKGLSLASTIKAALFKPKHGKIKTLIDEFDYPRLGPGQMYEAMAAGCEKMGVPVRRGFAAVAIETSQGRAVAVRVRGEDGKEGRIACQAVISSMPLTELARIIDSVPASAKAAADKLTYRSFMTVNLIIDQAETQPDTWIYIHDPALLVGRVQFFKNWSPFMVPEASKSSVGLEIFADEGDAAWTSPDADIISRAKAEAAKLGLIDPAKVIDSFVVRVPKAYPVFKIGYRDHVAAIRAATDAISNLQPVGRYGMFRYNNMDHSILTGLLAARNLCGERHDVWTVNTDAEYHEQGKAN